MGIGVTVLSDDRLDEELKRYGLEDMGGDPVDVLLLHIYANHEAALGAKDGTIAALESQNQDLKREVQALQEALERAWKHEDECHAYCSAFSPALERAALSPTQETDPETAFD